MDFQNRFMIGGWVAPPPTKNNYITLSRCGLNAIFLVGKETENYALAKRHLTAASKAGVSVFLGGGNDLSLAAVNARRFKSYENVAGVNVFDEPTIDRINEISLAAKRLKRANASRGFYINLLPSYSPAKALGESFAYYVDAYAALVAAVEKNGWLSFDYYPIVVDNGKPSLCKAWLSDTETVAKAAKKYGLKPHFFLQSMSFGGEISAYHDRKPTLEDFRLQMYTYIAYGAKGFTHFCYQSPVSPEFNETQTGLILSGKKTERWAVAKKANSEIRAFCDLLTALSWQGCVKISGKNGDKAAFNGLDDFGFSGMEFVKKAISDENILVGAYKGDSKEGYTIVNFADTSKNVTAKVKLTFNKPATLTVYKKGVKVVKTALKSATFTLGKGEGIFVIAEKA